MERGGDATVGRSILVPSVQEMAKQAISTVPARYVRHDRDDSVGSDKVSGYEIPVIDMLRLLRGDSGELKKLHSACIDWGFFQLVNHGVNTLLIDKMKREVEEFFKLPMEEKKRFWQTSEEIEGFGQAFVVSEEQKLDWCDMFFLTTHPISMRKPHLFPNLPLPFRDTLDCYSKELKTLAMTILAQISKTVGIEAKEMREMFEDGLQGMRMNYYPKCPQPDKAIGISPHSDSVGLTILLQLTHVHGLHINKDHTWLPVAPLPNAFTVNVGDILEIVTNGAYRSIEHRAIVNSESERMTIATFYSPNYEGTFGPSSSLITPQTPPLFKTVATRDYFHGLFSRELDGKSYLDLLRINGTSS